MKVNLEANYKDFYSISILERAKKVIRWERENDAETAKGWAEYAVREALKGTDDFLMEILKASAETSRNLRAWNSFGETEDMDVWIECTARTRCGFVIVGAYLTDIWKTGSEPYKHNMSIRRFEEV